LSKEALDFGMGDTAPPVGQVVKDVFTIYNTTPSKYASRMPPALALSSSSP